MNIDINYVFRQSDILARIQFNTNYAELKTNIDESLIEEVLAFNKAQIDEYLVLQDESSVFIYYPSFFSDVDAEMLWQEIQYIFLHGFDQKQSEEIDEPSAPPVESQESTIYSSTSTFNQSQIITSTKADSPKVKNKYNVIRISIGTEAFFVSTRISDKVYIQGTYGDKYNRTYVKEGFATNKAISNPYFCISYPVSNRLFIGYRLEVAIIEYAFDFDGCSYSETYSGISNRIEFGSYIKDDMFLIKSILSYTVGFAPEAFNDYAIGVSLGIPYVEAGFALDKFKAPSFFISLQYSWQRKKK